MKYIAKLDTPEKIEINDLTILHMAQRVLHNLGKDYNVADIFETGIKIVDYIHKTHMKI